MSIGSAGKFIQNAMNDKKLRAGINAATSAEGVQLFLKERKLPFIYSEFDEAYHNLLTGCQHAEQADRLKEFKMWWDLTMSMMQK